MTAGGVLLERSAFLERAAQAALNHVLAQNPWACARLAAFAGRSVALRCPPFPELRLRILESGRVAAAGDADEASLTVTLTPAALPFLAARDEGALRHVAIEGSAELAETVRSLFANLSWDVEEDLSRLRGDVLAHRLAAGGEAFLRAQREAALRLGETLAEYWQDEQPLLARPEDVAAFCRAVDALRDDVERLEKRIDLLAPTRGIV
ncbi:MAG TPA: SCP2 sterol-binding domain-containing protein [Burkholderiales bacterium]